eukprot:TRINITY_DN5680_c0_g1_i6.p1 TRINITY_DN5680_c0_g1~~TRINITY_DN5680_c0_g1_i6.p1  ORF type:complete len:202 (+),score=48.27 TRINITY_DN5680_c0_g1_i6:49-606(+)
MCIRDRYDAVSINKFVSEIEYLKTIQDINGDGHARETVENAKSENNFFGVDDLDCFPKLDSQIPAIEFGLPREALVYRTVDSEKIRQRIQIMNSLLTSFYRDGKKFEHSEKYRSWLKASKIKSANPSLRPQVSMGSVSLDKSRMSGIFESKPDIPETVEESVDEQTLRRRILLEAAQKRMDSQTE